MITLVGRASRSFLKLTLLTLLLTELGASGILYLRDVGGIRGEIRMYPSVPDRDLGWRPPPNTIYPVWSVRRSGETIYDLIYRTDAHGRRILSPVLNEKIEINSRSEALLLFGCSFVFSNGLPDQESLQLRMAEAMPDVEPVNYAGHGYGPQHMLRLLETHSLKDEVSKQIAGGVYFFFTGHFGRVMHASDQHYAAIGPLYELSGQELDYNGTFLAAHTYQYYYRRLINSVASLKVANIKLPMKVRQSDIDLVSRIIIRSSELFEAQTGKQLIVVFHPLYLDTMSAEVDTLEGLLSVAGVKVWRSKQDFSDLSKYSIQYDGHPNAEMNRILVRELAPFLATAF